MASKKRTDREVRDENKMLRRAVWSLSSALAFYGSPNTYFAIGFMADAPCGDFIRDFDKTELGFKPGKLARRTLDKANEKWEALMKRREVTAPMTPRTGR